MNDKVLYLLFSLASTQIFSSLLLRPMSRLSRLHTSHPDGTVLSKSSQVPAQFETPSQLFPLSLASFNFSLLLQGPPRPQTLTDKTSEQSAVAEENVETKKKRRPQPCQILRFRSPIIARCQGRQASKKNAPRHDLHLVHCEAAWSPICPVLPCLASYYALPSSYIPGSSSPCTILGARFKRERQKTSQAPHARPRAPYLNVLLTCAAKPVHDATQ